MNTDFKKSVLLITSFAPENSDFGTGFVVHRQAQETFIVTCDHVINKVGGFEQASINGLAAKKIASGEKASIDIAIVSVTGLPNLPPLPLCLATKTGDAFSMAGFQFFEKDGFLIRPLSGRLGEEVGLEFRGYSYRLAAWDLQVNEGHFDIQHGYSGSPVVNPEKGCVFGVASHRVGDKKGLAISIGVIKNIWPDMPNTLFEPLKEGSTSKGITLDPFLQLERKEMEKTLAHLSKRFSALSSAIMIEVDPERKVVFEAKLDHLRQEIRENQEKLEQLYQ